MSVTVVATFRLTACDSQSYKRAMSENAHPIKVYRKSQDPALSQGQFGREVGVTRFTVLRWEKGAPIDKDKLPKVSETIGVPAKELRPDLAEEFEQIFGGAS